MKKMQGRSAIVIGGSLAGLLAARILSDYFEQVTIIERDQMHDFPESRKGQPQTRHLHGLLVQGQKIVSHYFPDLIEGLRSGGTPVLDMAETMRWYCYGGYRTRFEFGMKGILTSRPFLEWHVRQRVAALPPVRIQDGCAVEKLVATDDHKQITGVQISRQGTEGETETIFADLVIDAGGKGSRSLKWLEELGYNKPPESAVKCGISYTSRLYERDITQPGSIDWVFITPEAPKERRLGGAFPIEDNKWMVMLAGWHGDYAPASEDGFIAYAKSLPAPDIYDIITASKPISDFSMYKYPASIRHHYEKLDRFPERYLVLGDAVCTFNPVYGQGMTSAAMQAQCLDKLLDDKKTLDGISKTYFKQVAKIVDIPWQMAVGEDFRFPQTQGKKAPGTDFINSYVERVHRATHHDPVVGAAFLKVMNMIEPPTSLMSPPILWRVFQDSIVKKRVAREPVLN